MLSEQNTVMPELGTDLRPCQPERRTEAKAVLIDADNGIWGKQSMIRARDGRGGWIEFQAPQVSFLAELGIED